MRSIALFALILTLAGLGACGYSFNSSQTTAIPAENRRLFITEVNNPTAETWLGPSIRNKLRDELTRRGFVSWADSRGAATGFLKVDIVKFIRQTAVSGASDQSLRYNATLTIIVSVLSPHDESVRWTSGEISETEPYFGGEEDAVDVEVVEQMVRRVAERMSLAF